VNQQKLKLQARQALLRAASFAAKYKTILLFVLCAGVLGTAFQLITGTQTVQSDQDYFSQKSLELKRVRFNESAITQLKALVDISKPVNPELLPNRTNPFGN
jgi:hypothetical protein